MWPPHASPRTPIRAAGGRAPLRRSAEGLLTGASLDVFLHAFTRPVVGDLARRRFHEVRRGRHDRPSEAPIERELATAYCVDDHSSAVWRVPYLELDLGVQGDVAEGGSLHADVAPLAVEEPRNVVRGTDVDILLVERIVEHARDRVRLADLLRLQTLALEHVEEVGVAAEVELVRPVETHAPVHEEPCEHAMRDRGADLRLDVVSDDREVLLRETLLPVRLPGDENRDAVDERATRFERLLDIPLGGLFAAHGQIAHDDVDLAIAEDPGDVVRGAGCLLDDL